MRKLVFCSRYASGFFLLAWCFWFFSEIFDYWSRWDLGSEKIDLSFVEEFVLFNLTVQLTFFLIYFVGRIDTIANNWLYGGNAGLSFGRSQAQLVAHGGWFFLAVFILAEPNFVMAIARFGYLLLIVAILAGHWKNEPESHKSTFWHCLIGVLLFIVVLVLHIVDCGTLCETLGDGIAHLIYFYSMFLVIIQMVGQIVKSHKEGSFNVAILEPILSLGLAAVAMVQVVEVYLKDPTHWKIPLISSYVLVALTLITIWNCQVAINFLKRFFFSSHFRSQK